MVSLYIFPITKHNECNKTKINSKNRGIKELDLLMGNWAMEYVDDLSDEECEELQQILNEETLDLVNILLKRADVPSNLNNSVMQRMIKWRDDGNITGYAK